MDLRDTALDVAGLLRRHEGMHCGSYYSDFLINLDC
jgi:hypothetical protein